MKAAKQESRPIIVRWVNGRGKECALSSSNENVIRARVTVLFLRFLAGHVRSLHIEH